MPSYPWLFEASATIDAAFLKKKMHAMNTLWRLNQGTDVGLPYPEEEFSKVDEEVAGKTEGDALIAYILKLGRDTAAK